MFAKALSRTLHTLTQPYFLRLLALCAGITLMAFLGLVLLVGVTLSQLSLFQTGWVDTVADVAGTLAAVGMGWLLFPVILPLIAVLFQEQIATIVDREEYQAEPETALPFLPELMYGLKTGLMALALNLLCLPLYFTVVLFPFVYFSLNGYLLGKEFFEMAAARHMGREAAVKLRKRYGTVVFLCGAAIVLMSTIPAVNLIAPFTGIALMGHLYWMIMEREKAKA